MTKTTTTCDQCHGSMEPPDKNDIHFFVLVEVKFKEPMKTREFCSRSCLSEYLKPKTETTP